MKAFIKKWLAIWKEWKEWNDWCNFDFKHAYLLNHRVIRSTGWLNGEKVIKDECECGLTFIKVV